MFGTFQQWITIAARIPKILWDDGEVDTRLTLEQMLPSVYGMQLEKDADGRLPPRPKDRQRQAPQAPEAGARTVDVA